MSMQGVRLVLVVCLVTTAANASAGPRIAWYNIQSGNGQQPLRGHTAPFVENTNCSDVTQPLNAWGVGFVQAELRAKVGADPSVIALGLAEAWRCASPARVLQVLGWRARTGERNGVALLSRYGFSGPEQWLQLDTSLNPTPRDTKWVVRAPVCVDAACSASVIVYAAHWFGTGDTERTTLNAQADATVSFMAQDAGRPHVLVGDLNVWEGSSVVCSQFPNNESLPRLRNAGYVDAWRSVHGDAAGYTGMLNRARCGVPEGSAWKRIDYAWVKGYRSAGMSRFGVTPPGDGAPSDHYGIMVEIDEAMPPPSRDPLEIVLRAAQAHTRAGAWVVESDVTAAGGQRLRHPDARAAKLTTARAAPANYFELSFEAVAGRPYRLWFRGRADRNSWANDSVFAQFDGTVSEGGAPRYRIGTTSATALVLEEGTNATLDGWGWQDNGYGAGVLGPAIYFARTGLQTIRIQTREDGLAIDQIVLSAGRYLAIAPGPITQF